MYSWMASRAKRNMVFSCQDHVVFCRKYPRHGLVNGVERRLKQISAEVADETDGILVETEVMPDHVHLLIDVDPPLGIHRVGKAKGAIFQVAAKRVSVAEIPPSDALDQQ
jgi:REP-associated tyrosine transposase